MEVEEESGERRVQWVGGHGVCGGGDSHGGGRGGVDVREER